MKRQESFPQVVEDDDASSNYDQRLRCRMYKKTLPEIGDFVMVRVKRLEANEAFVQLLEYDDHEAMVQYTELSNRRVRSAREHIRDGKLEVMEVLRVDEAKGYIDLSRKRVTDNDRSAATAAFAKAKAIHTIVRQLASVMHGSMLFLYEGLFWPLAEKHTDLHAALIEAAVAPTTEAFNYVFAGCPLFVPQQLETLIRRRFSALNGPVDMHATVEVRCFGPDGVDGIRSALKAAPDNVKVTVISCPEYMLSVTAPSESQARLMLENATEAIRTRIEALPGSSFSVLKAPARAGTAVIAQQVGAAAAAQ